VSDRSHIARAFTLIELLVVVAIIALLLSLLTPILARAKDVALRAKCQFNLKTVGQLTYIYAAKYGGRGPARCGAKHSNGFWAGRGPAMTLNVEVLGLKYYWQDNQVSIQTGLAAPATKPDKNRLNCPSMRLYSYPYPRMFLWNSDAGGDLPAGALFSDPGPYGRRVDPPPIAPLPCDGVTTWDYYILGPILEQFPCPAEQFLITEGHVASDYCGVRGPVPPYTIPLGGPPSVPPWTGLDGWFSFRHVLPWDPALYQTQATANFLYIDGHVNCMTPNDKINATDRFAFKY